MKSQPSEACESSILKAEEKDYKFHTNLGYITRICIKKIKRLIYINLKQMFGVIYEKIVYLVLSANSDAIKASYCDTYTICMS